MVAAARMCDHCRVLRLPGMIQGQKVRRARAFQGAAADPVRRKMQMVIRVLQGGRRVAIRESLAVMNQACCQ
jgi:hypothetical protein